MAVQSPPWPPYMETMDWTLVSNVGLFQSPLTGSVQRLARIGAYWQCHVRMRNLPDAELRKWRAFIAYVQDEASTFSWSPYPEFPQAYPFGSSSPWGGPIVSGASQTGTSLVVGGYNAGAMMKQGDWVSFSNGTYQELHQLKADVTANGAGSATLLLVPAIRISPANATSILHDCTHANPASRCRGEFMLADNQQASYGVAAENRSSLDFTIREALAA